MPAPIPTNPPRPKNLTAGELSPPPPAAMDSAGSPPPPSKRLVMVIADPSRESSVALQWALSHAVLEQDDLILLHVEPANPGRRAGTLSALLRRPAGNAGTQQQNQQAALSPTSSSSSGGSGEGGEWEFLEAMRAACEAAQPKVRVRVLVERGEVEGREKAAKILSQTKLLGVDLLVIGQRRSGSSFLG